MLALLTPKQRYQRAYRQAHREKLSADKKIYYQHHRNRITRYMRAYHQAHKPMADSQEQWVTLREDTLGPAQYLYHCKRWQRLETLPHTCSSCGREFFTEEHRDV